MRWGEITECGPVRKRNEDCLCVCPEIGFFAVADGMGGHRAGDVASKLAIDVLQNYLYSTADKVLTARDSLAQAVQQANEDVYRSAQKYAEHKGMGTTITACLVEGYNLSVANVGDSRALLLRNGNISKITNDHTLVQELIAGGAINEIDAVNHPQRNVLTRALGTEPYVQADFFEYKLTKGDRLLLCTDGLSSFVTEQRICRLMLSSYDPDVVLRSLLNEAIISGSNDNITMIYLAVD